MRAPRRSERYPSLVRVDTINGRPADEVAEGTRFDDLPATFPTERLALGADDPTLKAIEWLTPFGRGSRVAIAGGPRAPARPRRCARLAGALQGREGLELLVVLAGVRPEEVGEWAELEPVAVRDLRRARPTRRPRRSSTRSSRAAASRPAAATPSCSSTRSSSCPPHAARRALAAARNIVDGGSLTVIATAPAPLGGETTVIALDARSPRCGRFPALDLAGSGTLRAGAARGRGGRRGDRQGARGGGADRAGGASARGAVRA